MNILITGAAGLYGTHLTELLMHRPDVEHIYAVDDFSRDFLGDPFSFVEGHPAEAKFNLLKMDFRDINHFDIDHLKIDIVIHLAAFVSIPQSMDDPYPYFQNNEFGTFKLLQTLFKTQRRPLFIFASSPEVYGNPVFTPMRVDHPFNPRSVYATTKLAAEKHCLAMHQWYSYPTVIIRNFNTFGPNQNTFKYAAVIPNFIARALRGDDIIVDNDGTQTRDFMYVADAIRAYERVIERRDRVVGQVFNIGSGQEVMIKDLAEKIVRLTGSQSRIVYMKGRNADLVRLCADTTETQEMLDWHIETPFEEGLTRTIEWFRSHINTKQVVEARK